MKSTSGPRPKMPIKSMMKAVSNKTKKLKRRANKTKGMKNNKTKILKGSKRDSR
jgi:hypothetical protein